MTVPQVRSYGPSNSSRTAVSIERDNPTWTNEQLVNLRQGDLFESAPTEELEKIPYKFQYSFDCDHTECRGHTAICTDWEMGQSYRRWRAEYGENWEAKFRE
jgi:hypothetical protein